MKRKLHDMVVVITGASSGIGRATAHAFAERGAAVVLAARGEEPLRQAATECQERGARAIAVPTDVSDEESVKDLATHAVESFGRIDVWVNCAAVTLFSRFGEEPMPAYRQVIETNLFGVIYGARAALRYFREQGSGVLVNISSVVASMSQPYASAYAITKHGVRALSESLRQELYLEGAKHIHVCTVLPAVIDTPVFQHGANYTGWGVQAMPPVYKPERVARTIVSLAERPRREVFVGGMGRMVGFLRKIAPGMAERMMARQVHRLHLIQHEHTEPHDGNLYSPKPALDQVHGGWRSGKRAVLRKAAPLGLLALAVGVLSRNRPDVLERLGLTRRQPSLGERLKRPVERAIGR